MIYHAYEKYFYLNDETWFLNNPLQNPELCTTQNLLNIIYQQLQTYQR